MDQERRKIIVKEIEHWRRSKLLPDQYCDFLLNLYADADSDEHQPTSISGKAARAISIASWKHWLLALAIIFIVLFVVLYFSVFHPLLQIGLITSSVLLLLYLGYRYRPVNEAGGLSLIGAAMLVLLGSGLYMLQLHQVEEWGWKAVLLLACAVLWIALGIGARIPLLHLCGWLTIFLVYANLLANYVETPQWYEVQLYWLPAAFVFCWCSWFFHRWSHPVAAILFVAGVIIWFMPELYAHFFVAEAAELPLQWIIKILAGGILLFSLRKKWIAWVA
ncbi:hypothetical protein ACFQ0N_24580 [Paenibacillus sp. GCM10027626]